MSDLNDFQKPDLTSGYSDEVLQTIEGNISRVARMDPGTASNVPVGFVKLSDGKFAKWNGSSWDDVKLQSNSVVGDITYSAVDTSTKTVTTVWGSYQEYINATTLIPDIYLANGVGQLTKIVLSGTFGSIVGTNYIDSIYISPGSSASLTSLGRLMDVIYLAGPWDSYTKITSAETITLQRVVNGMFEKVVVSASATTSGNDKIVFSDGAVATSDARIALTANQSCLITDISGYDPTTKTLATPDSSFTLINSRAQSNRLLANGQIVSRTNYSALFAKIGTAFGIGDGSTTFQLPTVPDLATNVKAFISI